MIMNMALTILSIVTVLAFAKAAPASVCVEDGGVKPADNMPGVKCDGDGVASCEKISLYPKFTRVPFDQLNSACPQIDTFCSVECDTQTDTNVQKCDLCGNKKCKDKFLLNTASNTCIPVPPINVSAKLRTLIENSNIGSVGTSMGCNKGWKGSFCNEPVKWCQKVVMDWSKGEIKLEELCLNGGICKEDQSNGASCDCSETKGYSGKFCQKRPDYSVLTRTCLVLGTAQKFVDDVQNKYHGKVLLFEECAEKRLPTDKGNVAYICKSIDLNCNPQKEACFGLCVPTSMDLDLKTDGSADEAEQGDDKGAVHEVDDTDSVTDGETQAEDDETGETAPNGA